jgi:AraC-like DNA-binding protein
MTATDPTSHHVTSEDLIDELHACANDFGANLVQWPGLAVHRIAEPAALGRGKLQGLSLIIVAQGRRSVASNEDRHLYGPFRYVVMSGEIQTQAEVLDASAGPLLCLVLPIEPATVRMLSAEMFPRRSAARLHMVSAERPDRMIGSALDHQLMSAVVRFLRSLAGDTDRRVLAPLYLQEVVYRILEREQSPRILRLAVAQDTEKLIASAISHIDAHLAEPLTVAEVAARVNLSESAFSRRFREATGMSPYQYVKRMRLDRARALLIDRRLNVDDVSHAVGYSSTSHFIKAFRGRFGMTPGDFAYLPRSLRTR